MKLFLSSAGLTNQKLIDAFEDLVRLPSGDIKVAFIPTAANIEEGDKVWLINDLINLKKQGYSVDIVDISALSIDVIKPRLEEANVIFFGGGNTFHLMHWIEKSGLMDILPTLLSTRVYAGISAGSCVTGKTIYNSVQNLFGESNDLKIKKGLGLVDFQLIPHLGSQYFPKIREEFLAIASKEIDDTVYAIDDNSAVIVNEGRVEVVSGGSWKKYN